MSLYSRIFALSLTVVAFILDIAGMIQSYSFVDFSCGLVLSVIMLALSIHNVVEIYHAVKD